MFIRNVINVAGWLYLGANLHSSIITSMTMSVGSGVHEMIRATASSSNIIPLLSYAPAFLLRSSSHSRTLILFNTAHGQFLLLIFIVRFRLRFNIFFMLKS